jgi:hypothetical protein
MRILIPALILLLLSAACMPDQDSVSEPVKEEIEELDYRIDEKLTERKSRIRELKFDPLGQRNADGSLPRNVLDFVLGDPTPLASRQLKRGLSIQKLEEESGSKMIVVFSRDDMIHHIRTSCRIKDVGFETFEEIQAVILERYGEPHEIRNKQLIYLDKRTMVSFSLSYRKLLTKIYDLELNEFTDDLFDLIDQHYETLQ